ncbi:MAG: DUF4783 domain-containing protein [Bacteroidia bacterium]|nr:DUF4783 domain-containing protein [Bacteroidia bacterium]MDW8333304.1 DUF4783 domain-containing protein [Bacteroidia bacterium]
MKATLRLCIVGALWYMAATQRTPAQNIDEMLGQVEQAIGRNDAQTLARFFNHHVEITILDKEDTYPKNQAVFVVKEFFMNYPPRGFRFIHKGHSSDTYYAVGRYTSTRGIFDANVFIRKNGTIFAIEQLRFEQGK